MIRRALRWLDSNDLAERLVWTVILVFAGELSVEALVLDGDIETLRAASAAGVGAALSVVKNVARRRLHDRGHRKAMDRVSTHEGGIRAQKGSISADNATVRADPAPTHTVSVFEANGHWRARCNDCPAVSGALPNEEAGERWAVGHQRERGVA